MEWFKVDKEGLAKQLQRAGMAFIVRELWSNALDADGVTTVDVTLEHVGKFKYRITVRDDSPNGFKELSDAFTLFAESTRKKDASKRGRFGLGEKLVLAMCNYAEIRSTKGCIVFDEKGRHNCPRRKTSYGSIFTGTLFMQLADYELAVRTAKQFILSCDIDASFNDALLEHRMPISSFVATLPTELADESGVIHRTARKTRVDIYHPLPGYAASLYELGVPVVETFDKYDVDVQQKIPLTLDRENVPPAYLREIRTHVLNSMHAELGTEDANSTWVRDAASSEDYKPEAMQTVLTRRFGEKAVAYDPSDKEANGRAVAAGYTLVTGSMLNKDEWRNAKLAEALPAAGQVTPSPKAFSAGGSPLKTLAPENWDDVIRSAVAYAQKFACITLDKEISVVIAKDRGWRFCAAYGKASGLVLNIFKVRHMIDPEPGESFDSLLIHEFGHEYSEDHLSDEYHQALCDIGARAKRFADRLVPKGETHGTKTCA